MDTEPSVTSETLAGSRSPVACGQARQEARAVECLGVGSRRFGRVSSSSAMKRSSSSLGTRRARPTFTERSSPVDISSYTFVCPTDSRSMTSGIFSRTVSISISSASGPSSSASVKPSGQELVENG